MFEKSFELGNPAVLTQIGNLYYYDVRVKRNYSKAKEYLERAAEYGEPPALNMISNLYYYGKGVEKDYSKAKEYYEKAEKQNSCTCKSCSSLLLFF